MLTHNPAYWQGYTDGLDDGWLDGFEMALKIAKAIKAQDGDITHELRQEFETIKTNTYREVM